MKPNSLLITLFLISLLNECEMAKIVVYSPTISFSHMKVNAAVADTLASFGHDVTIVDVHYMVDPRTINYSTKAKRHVFPLPAQNTTSKTKVDMNAVMKYAFKEPSYYEQWTFTRNYQQLFNRICKVHLMDDKILPFLRSEHFDFVISEHVDLCGTAMSYAASIQTHVLLSTCPLFEHTALTIGLHEASSFVPAFQHSTKHLKINSLWSRVENTIDWAVGYWGLHYGSQLVNQVFRERFGPNFPDVDDLVANSALTLVNSDEFVDFARQTQHNIINIGGLGLRQKIGAPFESKDLGLFELMEGSPKGVVYFSLGSITSTTHMPSNFMENLVRTFEHFKDYQFIIKVDVKSDFLTQKHNSSAQNLHFLSWAPQLQILGHPKTRLFITHAGYGSVLESAYAGVPTLCLPFFMDQYRNAEMIEQGGWGRVFEKHELQFETKTFQDAIDELLTNESYSKNAKRLQKLLNNCPQTAESRLHQAIQLLEMANFKLPEIRPKSSGMNFMTRHNYDILFMFTLFALLIVQLFMFIVYRLIVKITNLSSFKDLKTDYEKIE